MRPLEPEQFVPFSIIFASGQQFKIKSRDHIGMGPVNRSDVERLKTVIVWDDAGQWRSVYMAEHSHSRAQRHKNRLLSVQ